MSSLVSAVASAAGQRAAPLVRAVLIPAVPLVTGTQGTATLRRSGQPAIRWGAGSSGSSASTIGASRNATVSVDRAFRTSAWVRYVFALVARISPLAATSRQRYVR